MNSRDVVVVLEMSRFRYQSKRRRFTTRLYRARKALAPPRKFTPGIGGPRLSRAMALG